MTLFGIVLLGLCDLAICISICWFGIADALDNDLQEIIREFKATGL